MGVGGWLGRVLGGFCVGWFGVGWLGSSKFAILSFV